MTITKQDLDAFIEREADRILYPHVDRRPFNLGAQLVVPLLLQAVAEGKKLRDEMIQSFCGCNYDEECDAHFYATKYDEALNQIEAAVASAGETEESK